MPLASFSRSTAPPSGATAADPTTGAAAGQPASAPAASDDLGADGAAATPLRVEYSSTWRDLFRFSAVHQFLSVKLQVITLASVAIIVWFYAADYGLVTAATLFVEIFIAFWVFQLLVTAIYLHSSRNRSLLTHRALELRDDALTVESEFSLSHFYWSGIDRAVSHPGYVAIYLNAHLAEVIPDRAFDSAAHRANFLATAIERIATAHGRRRSQPAAEFQPGAAILALADAQQRAQQRSQQRDRQKARPEGQAQIPSWNPPWTPPRVQPCLQRQDLVDLANRGLADQAFRPAFAPGVEREVKAIESSPAAATAASGPARPPGIRDLRTLAWCSLTRADDLPPDLLTASEPAVDGGLRILVAVADVDHLVGRASALDRQAQANATAILTPAQSFPMLPEPITAGLAALLPGVDRLALVFDLVFDDEGSVREAALTRALVQNKADLDLETVAAWLDGNALPPEAAAAVAGLEARLRHQDAIARRLGARRRAGGDLDLPPPPPRTIFAGDRVVAIEEAGGQRAQQLVDELSLAAQQAAARFLAAGKRASLRHVIRTPADWPAIRALAESLDDSLPVAANAVALRRFIARQRLLKPVGFAELSSTLGRLLGPGEYVVATADQASSGKASSGATLSAQSLAGQFDFPGRGDCPSHSPGRRFADLVNQRLLKAALANLPAPYSARELGHLAAHCTAREHAAGLIEAEGQQAAAAGLMTARASEEFSPARPEVQVRPEAPAA